MKKWIITIVLCLLFVGCETVMTIDPVTGEAVEHTFIDPNKAAVFEESAEGLVATLGALGGAWPILLPVATGLAGALGIWRKVKPNLTKAQSESQMYHSTAKSLVQAIEELKRLYPQVWQTKLKDILGEMGPKTENIIRALRGLEPRE